MRNRFVVAVALASGFVGSVAQAQYIGPQAYNSFAESPFSGLSFKNFQLENFEDFLFNVTGVSVPSNQPFFITSPSALTDSVDGDDGSLDGSGAGGRSLLAASSVITFNFDPLAPDGLPTHAGVVWTDVGIALPTSFSAAVRFEAYDANGLLIPSGIDANPLGDGNVDGGTLEDRFFGIVHLPGISSIRLITIESNDWELDHLQFGVIPEPSSLGLVAIAGVGMLRRRK